MVKTLVLAVTIVAILGIAFVSAEEEKKVTVTTTTVSGNLVRIDPDTKAIVIKDTATGKETTYMFNDTTMFYKDGSTIEVTKLNPNETVTLKISPDQENVIVRLDSPKIVVEEED